MTTTLGPSYAELGAQFFFAHHLTDEPPLSSLYVSWLQRAYRSEAGADEAVQGVVEAIGLAGILNTRYAPGVVIKARECYGRALRATNKALSDPVRAKSDLTLLAVLMLGHFEVCADNCRQPVHLA
jgi:hypothetical protein